MFLKIILRQGVQKFGRTRKLALRFIKSFESLEMVGTIVYQLAMPSQLVGRHGAFHMSMLQKKHRDLPMYWIGLPWRLMRMMHLRHILLGLQIDMRSNCNLRPYSLLM